MKNSEDLRILQDQPRFAAETGLKTTRLSERYLDHIHFAQQLNRERLYPYFRTISSTSGTEVLVDGKKLLMISSNDYLGLAHDERVIAKSCEMIRVFGTGTGGSRLLCGNLALHEHLEGQLAEFVGKNHAMVYSTGFMTNLGAISSMLTSQDIILFDKENHASIFDACKLSQARIIPFAHNNPDHALKQLKKCPSQEKQGIVMLITEGVFSMSGSVVDLPAFIELKKHIPHLFIYLDDAHGIGTMGPAGQGVASLYDAREGVDFIMGTFSKSFGSIGGFIACDDPLTASHLRHTSRTMLFSAALPAGNVASVLAALEVMKNDPEPLARLWENVAFVRKGYQKIGLEIDTFASPIIPIHIGDENRAMHVSRELYSNGIFAIPVIHPAVPRGRAIIRTSFMSSHSRAQLEFFLTTLENVLKKFDIPN